VTPPSTAARLAAQAARMDAAMNSAVTNLTGALPNLSPGEATTALEVAVPITVRGAGRFLEELVAHLCVHPDALTSGDSRCPPVLIRLTHVLHDGHQVVRPGCAHCGKTGTELRQLRPEGRVCGTCDGRSRRSTCARCGQQEVRIAARRPEGKVCYRCYQQDPATFQSARAARVVNSNAPRSWTPKGHIAMRAITSSVNHAVLADDAASSAPSPRVRPRISRICAGVVTADRR
jgi:hypothetical protein